MSATALSKTTRLINRAAKLTINVNRAQRSYECMKDTFAMVFGLDRRFLKPMVDAITSPAGLTELSDRQKGEIDNLACTLKFFQMLKIDSPIVKYLKDVHSIDITVDDVPTNDKIDKETYAVLCNNGQLMACMPSIPKTTAPLLSAILKKSAELQLEIFDNVGKVNTDIKPRVLEATNLRGEEFSRLVSLNRNRLVKRAPRVVEQLQEFSTAQKTFTKLAAVH